MDATLDQILKDYLCLLIDANGKICVSDRVHAGSLLDAYDEAEHLMHDCLAAGYELWLGSKLMAVVGTAMTFLE